LPPPAEAGAARSRAVLPLRTVGPAAFRGCGFARLVSAARCAGGRIPALIMRRLGNYQRMHRYT
jgi:hypothetical protein